MARQDKIVRGSGRALLLGICLLSISACGKKPPVESTPPPPPPSAQATPAPAAPVLSATPDLKPSRRLALAAGLLDQGKEAQARVELVRLLADKPDEDRATDLLRQIDTDPKQLYGIESFAYQLKGKENLVDMAQRFLGSRYRFWGLAKYNGIPVPDQVTPGQTVMIPGKVRNLELPPPPRRVTPRRADAAGAAAATAPAAPAVDRPRAQQLRRAGLEQLSAGSIDRAVALLGQAQSLDPGNGAIRGDLARAQRIQAAVRR